MRKEFNKIILEEAKRLANLINDVLDISKIEGGKIVLSKTEFDINEILRKCVEKVRANAKAKRITLSVDIPPEAVLVYADEERITQLFENLLANAVKFNVDEGRVTVLAQNLFKEYEVIIVEGNKVGRVNGLAVIGVGAALSGIVLPIESEVTPGGKKAEFIATGRLGKIAQEAVKNVSAIVLKYFGEDIKETRDIYVQFLQTYFVCL